MKYPAYPHYKDSSVAWLGQVPGHWEVKRLKMATHLCDKKVEADEENPLPYIGMENIESWSGKLLFIDPDLVPSGVANYFSKGTTLFGKLRPYLAKACAPGFSGLCSTELLVIQAEDFDRRALLYWLLADGFIKLVDSSTYGSKMPRANWDFIGNCQLAVPPMAEQTAIADFLDRETGRIDMLVAKKRKLVELLKEKRSALISRTVTRGLPDYATREFGLTTGNTSVHEAPRAYGRGERFFAPTDGTDITEGFKDFGIEWLRAIPKGWEILPFTKYVSDKSDYRGKTPEKTDSGVFLVTARNVRMGYIDYVTSQEYVAEDDYAEIMRRGLPMIGDVLFTTEAPLGNVALVDKEDVAFAQRMIRFRMDKKHFSSAFTLYAMMSDHFQNQLKSLSTGSTAEGLKASKLTILKIICPPIVEQTAIAAYLDRETTKIDRLIEKVETAIARLQEYRSALITAAVTGKIDVRGAA